MVAKKLDLLEMPENERVRLIRELEHKISEKRSQQPTPELDNLEAKGKRICIENQRLSRICFGDITKKCQYSYLFTRLIWCIR